MNPKSGSSLLVSVDDDSEEIRKPSVLANSPPMDMKPADVKSEATSKGYGLKKWRRIRRDVSMVGETSVESGKMVMQDMPDSIVHRSKRTQVYSERQQKSGGSVSSTYAENSEDCSSKLLTATRIRNEMPVVVEQNSAHSMQHGKGKGLNEAMKKSRGARLIIEKETSRSSVESDSRVFVQGPNGTQCERPVHCDGENGDELQGSKQQVRNGYGREETQELASSSYQDMLVDSIFVLRTAQEALEKEVLKFKEISEHTSVKYIVLDTHPEFTDAAAKFQETSFAQFPTSEGVHDSPWTLPSKLVEIENRDVQRELENLFLQRIAAEVEYIVISKMVQNQRVGAFSEQWQMLYNSGDKTATFEKYSWTRENFEGISSANETLKLQKRVCVHTSYFFLQLFLLLVILGVFIFQFSPNYVEVVPT